jgi:uncharacterized repeat protein (TIGR03803 family)
VLYGTTTAGGTANMGTVFKLTPPNGGETDWTETVIYNFKGGRDGSQPSAVIADDSGALYGTTPFGGTAPSSDGNGTVFKLTPGRKLSCYRSSASAPQRMQGPFRIPA